MARTTKEGKDAMAGISLEFVHKGPASSVPDVTGNSKDETLLYLGEMCGQVVSRVGSVGRVLRCDTQSGEASLSLFYFHGPAKKVLDVISKIGESSLRGSVVLAYMDGRFYLVEKEYAYKECRALDCV